MSSEIETRVAVLETKSDYQAEKLDKIEVNLKDTHGMVFSIKERLDKQNGAIPHMAEKIDLVSEVVNELKNNQTKDSSKLSVIWGVAGAIGRRISNLRT